LRALLKGSTVYERLCNPFREADERYNSGLFHFQKEKDVPEPPDTLTPNLVIDDKPLKDIVKRLYYPESPYEFSALPADVLGHVYEQFLGKVIRLTPSHQVTVEEKPEVRKAGGVYYTPTFIVNYIVQHTLSKLLEGKKPGLRGSASKIKIVDPACGSGSFLIVAYQYLLDWHRDRYVEDGTEKHRKELYQGAGGQWLLTTQEKKRILLNSIYGVDIDPQAVEVTKLSLLLKVLEGESSQSLNSQLRLFHERALPDLDRNIKCGNSLIDSNFYQAPTLPLFDDETQYRINAFDWRTAFPQVFSDDDPGFDTVIGNPPYIRIQALKEWAPLEVEYYKKAYRAAEKGNYDIYVVFVEKGLSLLNKQGQLGFILPHKFFNAQYGEPLRALLANNHNLSEVVHFGDKQIFEQATTYTCLLFLEKAGSKQFHLMKVDDLLAWRNSGEVQEKSVPAETITHGEWNFIFGDSSETLQKLNKYPTKLGDITRIFQGLVTSADKIFVLEEVNQPKDGYIKVRDRSGQEWVFEQAILKPFINKVTVSTYKKPKGNHWIIFPYKIINGKAMLIPASEVSTSYPKAWQYLITNNKALRERESGKADNDQWYGYIYPKNLTLFDPPKLIVQVISLSGRYAYDENKIYFTGGGNGPYYGILWLDTDNPHSLHYLQGLLTSKLLDAYLHSISSPFRGGYWSYGKRFIEQIPIRIINFADPTDKAHHDRMVELVERMQSLHKWLDDARASHDKTILQQQIAVTDQQIERLVNDLYGLTEEEIRLVEGTYQHG
jgi:type I restriction-modification system DNA methylase subunit